MKRAIIVGSGAGGSTVAKELQGKFDVTVLEAGKEFKPLKLSLSFMETIKRTGLLFDEREIQLAFPVMKIRKTKEMVLVNGIGIGGTTPICTGNALRLDHDLKKLGINLDTEFTEIYREIPVNTAHQKRWRENTKKLFAICQEMNLNPQPMPKMGDYENCSHCGRCVFGCPQGIKWDSRRYLKIAQKNGAEIITGCKVEKVEIENGKARGVWVRKGITNRFYSADLIILAAGGFATPVILQNSGINCEPNLFVDPVLCVATEWKDCQQQREVEMPFVIQKQGFIISPYFDYLSFFFNPVWRYPAKDILGIMIKLADMNTGSISKRGLRKTLTAEDKQGFKQGIEICTEMIQRFGTSEEDIFLGTINAGHPGGMLPLTEQESKTFHSERLPDNLYVADATLIPKALGNPPILTIIAIAKRVSNVCKQLFG